ncbi:hypothetical protein, partial [Salmonella enterica]|uniref:hypothetical protein n=1 Tax=Salmonella enterica TaxID=28901 RepID=UPI003F7438B8
RSTTGKCVTSDRLYGAVALEKGTIHLRETKTGIERYVQLSDQAIDFLKQEKAHAEQHAKHGESGI